MTGRPGLDRRLANWLAEEAAGRARDDLIDATRERLRNTSQRPGGPAGVLLRAASGHRSTRLAVGVVAATGVAAVAVVVAGLLIARPNQAPGAAGPAATNSDGLILPGRYATQDFARPIVYTVPPGWTLAADSPTRGFILSASNAPALVEACWQPQASLADGNLADPGVGRTSDAISRHLASRVDIRVIGRRAPLELDGLHGHVVEVEGLGETAGEVVLLSSPVVPSSCARNLYGTERLRMGFIDLPDGTTLSIAASTFAGRDILDAAWAIVTTFELPSP